MGDKDIAACEFEHLSSIFADIVNAFFAIHGIAGRVRPEDLRDARTRTSYKSNGGLRSQARDLSKYWMTPAGNAVLCLLGLENQSSVDTYMALRVAGYDGAEYRSQIPPRRRKGKRYRARRPHYVITIVLYFGTRRRWPRRRSLQERLGVPECYRGITMEAPVNVLELAWLTEEQEALFESDMRHVVRYLRREQLGGDAVEMLPDAIEHAPELLELLFALTGDLRFKEAIAGARRMQEKGEPITLTSFLEQAERRGLEQGLEQGLARGRAEERKILTEKLIARGWTMQEAASFTGLSL